MCSESRAVSAPGIFPFFGRVRQNFKHRFCTILRDITRLRRRIATLEGASPWLLAKDWEIRVDSSCEENLRGYFVNHKEMITTHECPPPPEPGEKHFLARSMPDHRSFTGELMKVVDSR